MVHHRQCLPLGFKARNDILAVHARLNDFQSNFARNRLLLLGDIDDAKTTLADLFTKFVRADLLANNL